MAESRSVAEFLDSKIKQIADKVGGIATVIFSSLEVPHLVMKTLTEAGVGYRVVLGKYENEYETSYMIDPAKVRWLLSSGLVDGQESLLFLSDSKQVYLVYNQLRADGTLRIEALGESVQLKQEELVQHKGWTYDPELEIYWGTKAA